MSEQYGVLSPSLCVRHWYAIELPLNLLPDNELELR